MSDNPKGIPVHIYIVAFCIGMAVLAMVKFVAGWWPRLGEHAAALGTIATLTFVIAYLLARQSNP